MAVLAVGKEKPEPTWPGLQRIVLLRDPSWEIRSTKAAGGVPKMEIALENVSKPFNKNNMPDEASRAMHTGSGSSRNIGRI